MSLYFICDWFIPSVMLGKPIPHEKQWQTHMDIYTSLPFSSTIIFITVTVYSRMFFSPCLIITTLLSLHKLLCVSWLLVTFWLKTLKKNMLINHAMELTLGLKEYWQFWKSLIFIINKSSVFIICDWWISNEKLFFL